MFEMWENERVVVEQKRNEGWTKTRATIPRGSREGTHGHIQTDMQEVEAIMLKISSEGPEKLSCLSYCGAFSRVLFSFRTLWITRIDGRCKSMAITKKQTGWRENTAL